MSIICSATRTIDISPLLSLVDYKKLCMFRSNRFITLEGESFRDLVPQVSVITRSLPSILCQLLFLHFVLNFVYRDLLILIFKYHNQLLLVEVFLLKSATYFQFVNIKKKYFELESTSSTYCYCDSIIQSSASCESFF